MNLWNKITSTFKIYVPIADRILEMAALAMTVGLLSFTFYLYQCAPEQLYVHFSHHNATVTEVHKIYFWFAAAFFLLLMLLSAWTAYHPNRINMPIRLKEAVFDRQKRYMSRMGRCLTLAFGLLWLSTLLNASASFLKIKTFALIFEQISLASLLIIVVYFSTKIWWIGRKR